MTKSIGKWRTETKEEDSFTDAIGFIWKLVSIPRFWRHWPKPNDERGFPLKGDLQKKASPFPRREDAERKRNYRFWVQGI